jgi:hypothetical protein
VSDQSSRDSAKGLHVVDVRARVPGTGSLVTDFQSPKLEAVYLERRVVKSLLIQVYGLGVYGFGHSDSVQLHKTSDGVQITRSDTWSAQGVHVVDVRARVPGTGNSVTDFQSPKHSQAPLHDRRRRGAREVDDVREHGRGGGLLRGLAGVAGDRRFMLRRSEARCPHIRKQLMLVMSIISALRRKI